MRHQNPSPEVPHCPACGAAHYPARTLGGRAIWCDGSPANGTRKPKHDERARAIREHQRREEREGCFINLSEDGVRALIARRHLRGEHRTRQRDGHPLDEIDRARFNRLMDSI